MSSHAILLAPLILAGAVLATAAGAQSAAPTPPREGLSIDERRPDQPFSIDLFGRPVQLTGSWEYKHELRRNFDLDASRARDRRIREHEIKLEARSRVTPDTEVFLRAVGLIESRHTQNRPSQHTSVLERGQSWIKFERLGGSPWALQVGRLALVERRSFWWDEDLDAVRIQYPGRDWQLDTGLAYEVAGASSAQREVAAEARDVTRWFGQATWRIDRRHRLDGFWLVARDRSGQDSFGRRHPNDAALDPSDFDGHWLGLRASGQWRPQSGPRVQYWADTALVRGREAFTTYTEDPDGQITAGATRTRTVRGTALDLGATVVFRIPYRPSFTVAYARGSGGTRDGALDANFRQTGLQENKARLAGVKRLQRFGELLQPELSNLRIATLGAGVRFLERSSFELLFHRYRQLVPRSLLSGSRLSADPLGRDGDIGDEIDVVLAFRESKRFEIVLRYSHFRPGAAFAPDERDHANALEITANVNF